MDNNLHLLGIAKKAGLLAVGADAVSIAARTGKAKLIITASDASGGALRRARASAESGGVMRMAVPYTMLELGIVTGRGSPGTVAVLDAGLAAGFMRGLARIDPTRYLDAAEQLDAKARALAERKKRRAEQ